MTVGVGQPLVRLPRRCRRRTRGRCGWVKTAVLRRRTTRLGWRRAPGGRDLAAGVDHDQAVVGVDDRLAKDSTKATPGRSTAAPLGAIGWWEAMETAPVNRSLRAARGPWGSVAPESLQPEIETCSIRPDGHRRTAPEGLAESGGAPSAACSTPRCASRRGFDAVQMRDVARRPTSPSAPSTGTSRRGAAAPRSHGEQQSDLRGFAGTPADIGGASPRS